MWLNILFILAIIFISLIDWFYIIPHNQIPLRILEKASLTGSPILSKIASACRLIIFPQSSIIHYNYLF